MRTTAIRSILFAGIALAILAPASAAVAASAAPAHPVAVAQARSVTPRVPTHCNPGHFCSYNDTNGTSPCLQQATSTTYLNWPGTCANEDESLNNNIAGPGYPGLTRVYYSAYEAGAWMCMNAGNYIDDVTTGHNGPYRFDQGSKLAGYGKVIYKDIASSEIDPVSSCVINN
ncbi:MAG TPA: hypothetical protein VFI65_02640 [Streptosporangiaceae bacterium]|nr:hypothetical protein [Streptosporangiaceae bacterium]